MTDTELIIWLKEKSRQVFANTLDQGQSPAGRKVRSQAEIYGLAAERIIELTAERDAWKLRASSASK